MAQPPASNWSLLTSLRALKPNPHHQPKHMRTHLGDHYTTPHGLPPYISWLCQGRPTAPAVKQVLLLHCTVTQWMATVA